MNRFDNHTDSTEALLVRALREEAAQVEPKSDALQAIQRRTSGTSGARTRWSGTSGSRTPWLFGAMGSAVATAAVITSVVLIGAEKGAVGDLGEKIAAVPGVSEVYSVTGDWELVALVRVHAHEEIAEVVTGGIAKVPGVRGTHTMIAFQAFSNSDLERLWGIGFDDAEGM